MAARGSFVSTFSTAVATLPAKAASSVIRIDCAASSCSACESRSAAIQAGSFSLSAITRISDGPAMRSMPTWPNTIFLAAAT